MEYILPNVIVKPYPIIEYASIDIVYKGRLTSLKNNKLFIYYGYGCSGLWLACENKEMFLASGCYHATIKIKAYSLLNFCFHDDQGHWDNNKGHNWHIRIEKISKDTISIND